MTETHIANLALRKIGNWRIYDLTANAQLEELVREQLVQIRQAMIRSHVWDFAVDREELYTTTSPAFGESFAYSLPANYMQLIEVWLQSSCRTRIDKFRIEGKTLVTDREEAYIVYIADVVDPSIWAPDFRDCIVTKLAVALCPHFNIDMNISRSLESDYENILRPRALLNNAWEDASGENNPIEELMRRSTYLNQNNVNI